MRKVVSIAFVAPGVVCHWCLSQVNIFKDATEIMVGFAKEIKSQGFDIKYLDIGGGLGIDYYHRHFF
jgi:diaminopimelate decarboxylase